MQRVYHPLSRLYILIALLSGDNLIVPSLCSIIRKFAMDMGKIFTPSLCLQRLPGPESLRLGKTAVLSLFCPKGVWRPSLWIPIRALHFPSRSLAAGCSDFSFASQGAVRPSHLCDPVRFYYVFWKNFVWREEWIEHKTLTRVKQVFTMVKVIENIAILFLS